MNDLSNVILLSMCLPITAAAWPGPLVHHQPAPWPAATRDGLQALASQMVTAGFPWAGNELEQTSRCSWGGWGCHDAGGRRARTWQNTRIYEVTSEELEGRTSCEGSEMRLRSDRVEWGAGNGVGLHEWSSAEGDEWWQRLWWLLKAPQDQMITLHKLFLKQS